MNNALIEQKIGLRKSERPGREISLDHSVTGNKNVSFKVGTVDDKNKPSTVYVCATFWVGLKENGSGDDFGRRVSSEYKRELQSIYKNKLKDILKSSRHFPFHEDNIYMFDCPENIAYNNKKCFTSIELNLHTVNCLSSRTKNYPLKNIGDTELFDELINIAKTIASSELLKGKKGFTVHKRKR
jgi:hypothetical protein